MMTGAGYLKTFTPTELATVLRAVLRIGTLMLRSGAASFRTQDVMLRCAAVLGIERLEAYVTPTGIIASAYSGDEHRTQIVQAQGFGVDMNRVIALELLSRRLKSGTTAGEIMAQVDAIEAQGTLYSRRVVIWAVAVACGAFAVLLGGGLMEFLAATLGAGLGQWLRMGMIQRKFNPIPITAVCALVAAAIAYPFLLITGGFAPLIGISPAYTPSGVIAAVLLLVPGVPLVTAMLDMTRLDLVSGAARGLYAIMILVTIGTAMAIVLAVFGLSEEVLKVGSAPQPTLAYFALMGVLSFIATIGFAVLFNVPSNLLVWCGVVGMGGNLARLGLLLLHASPEAATYCAAVLIGLFGYFVSVRYQLPRLVFTVTGIITLIPGVTGFSVVELFLSGDVLGGVGSSVKALLLTGAIVAGLGTARILVDTDLRHIAHG